MINQADTQGRLRLLRYGLIVVVIITFFVALLAPYAYVTPWAIEFNALGAAAAQANGEPFTPVAVAITDFIGNALLYSVIVAIICVAIYFVYSRFITVSPAKS